MELERYAVSSHGEDVWTRAAGRAGTAGTAYRADTRYDDEQFVAQIVALAAETGSGPQTLLEAFGDALAPTLVSAYAHLIPPGWRTIDLIDNTEAIIHTALRHDDPSARPPLLRTARRGDDEVLLIYASARRMCGLAKGIAHGVASHFGEAVAIEDESCMLTGDATCALAIRRVS